MVIPTCSPRHLNYGKKVVKKPRGFMFINHDYWEAEAKARKERAKKHARYIICHCHH